MFTPGSTITLAPIMVCSPIWIGEVVMPCSMMFFGDVVIVMVQADEDHILRNIDSVVYSDRADNRIAQSDSAIIADDDISYGIVQAGVIFNDRIFT